MHPRGSHSLSFSFLTLYLRDFCEREKRLTALSPFDTYKVFCWPSNLFFFSLPVSRISVASQLKRKKGERETPSRFFLCIVCRLPTVVVAGSDLRCLWYGQQQEDRGNGPRHGQDLFLFLLPPLPRLLLAHFRGLLRHRCEKLHSSLVDIFTAVLVVVRARWCTLHTTLFFSLSLLTPSKLKNFFPRKSLSRCRDFCLCVSPFRREKGYFRYL